MINYHGKFIRNLSSILQPLNQLLQGNQEFKWSPWCEETSKKAKVSLSSSNVLVHYDPSLPVILESDASQYGIEAVIFHRFPNGDKRPIAYASRSLNSSEKNYSQIEKEGLYREDASVEEEIFHVAPQQLKRHPVSAAEIAKDTSRNPLLAKALLLTQNGWPINSCLVVKFLIRHNSL